MNKTFNIDKPVMWINNPDTLILKKMTTLQVNILFYQ